MPHDDAQGSTIPRRLAPLLVLAGSWIFFVAHFPERLYGDDVWLVRCIVQEQPFTPHFLYMPLARACAWLGAGIGLDPFTSLRLLAASGTALGAAFLCAAALLRGFSTWASIALALLSIGTASALFFATAGEIHGVHLGAVGLFAWSLARLSREASSLRVLVAALAFGLVVGTHRSGVLLFPGGTWLALLACGRRSGTQRARDLAALLAGGGVMLGLMFWSTWRDTGAVLHGSGSISYYVRGLQGRFEAGFGLRDFITYLSRDGVAPAWALVVAGLGALGTLLRRHPRLALGLSLCALPYVLFFPVFNFPERGAYFVVLLPALALTLGLWLLGPPSGERDAGRATPARTAILLVALLGAWMRPDELVERLGPITPTLVAAAAFALGLAAPARPLSRRAGAGALALLLVLQLAGSLRTLLDFGREHPLLDWTRAVCEETAGKPSLVITTGFGEFWLLAVVSTPWPAPYTGTWDFAEQLPRPTPSPFLYGDLSVTHEELAAGLRRRVTEGEAVYLDERVIEHVESVPQLGKDLEHIRANYRLEPIERGGFRAQRLRLQD